MLSTLEWFDITNNAHLRRIDDRLNQNVLLGAAIYNLTAGRVGYARGETLLQAAINLVPRVIWPDKPIRAGGNKLVSSFTGIIFANGTTVGVGQLMEFYINFGTSGVVIGFFTLGLAVAGFDRAAAIAIQHGHWKRFAFWYLSGMGFLLTNNALFEITGSVAAGMVAVFLVNRFVLPALSGPAKYAGAPTRHTWPPTAKK
jgi:hypothetical protein